METLELIPSEYTMTIYADDASLLKIGAIALIVIIGAMLFSRFAIGK